MPVNSIGRKMYSSLVTGVSSFEGDTATNYNFATVDAGGTTTIDNIGVPVIWVNANNQFEVYIAQGIAAAVTAGGSPLSGGSVVAIAVGNYQGYGFNPEDTNLAAADAKLTVLHRGPAGIAEQGMEWGTAAAPAQVLFRAAIEANGIAFVDNADVVSPTYTS